MELMNFNPMEAVGTRHYIVVAPITSRLQRAKVECIYRGPRETDQNIELVGEALASAFDEIFERYDPAVYNIATVRARSVLSLKAAVPEFRGWRGVPTYDIRLP